MKKTKKTKRKAAPKQKAKPKKATPKATGFPQSSPRSVTRGTILDALREAFLADGKKILGTEDEDPLSGEKYIRFDPVLHPLMDDDGLADNIEIDGLYSLQNILLPPIQGAWRRALDEIVDLRAKFCSEKRGHDAMKRQYDELHSHYATRGRELAAVQKKLYPDLLADGDGVAAKTNPCRRTEPFVASIIDKENNDEAKS